MHKYIFLIDHYRMIISYGYNVEQGQYHAASNKYY